MMHKYARGHGDFLEDVGDPGDELVPEGVVQQFGHPLQIRSLSFHVIPACSINGCINSFRDGVVDQQTENRILAGSEVLQLLDSLILTELMIKWT